MSVLYGAIEAGGTKFLCAVGTRDGQIVEQMRIDTTSPEETIGKSIDFFHKSVRSSGPLASIGIASFGPLDARLGSPTFGKILTTPKPGWAHTDVVGPFRDEFNVPIGFDTDVNGAALGEWRWGAAQGLETFIYLTIGTGIGGGGLIRDELMHGLLHPEMGHIVIPRDYERDPFEGTCPFHGDCFEGLASGPALNKRYGTQAESLGRNHPAWELEAHYIALALQIYICTLSPQRIILGGGVMQQKHLFQPVREKTLAALNEYIQLPQIIDHVEKYIVPPTLEGNSGILGGLVLAERAASLET